MFVTLTRGGRWAAPVFLCIALTLVTGCDRAQPPFELSNSYADRDDAVRAFLRHLEADNQDALAAAAVTESEFLKSIWPALPASRPEVGMPAERAWTEQAFKNQAHLAQLISEHGRRRYELIRTTFSAPPTEYSGFTIHPETHLEVRDGSKTVTLRLFGSMIESGGRWKIYSFVVD